MRKQLDNVNHRETLAEESPLELIHAVMHAYRSQQYQVLRDGSHDLTHMESKVLSYLEKHPGATQSELSRDSGRDKAQLARLIKSLRERGLLTGASDEIDRRNVHLSLTAGGSSVLRALNKQSIVLAARAVAGLNQAELRMLVSLLRRVHENFDSKK
jgi:DNA-binding MarR family transcriptional regulator